MASSRRVSIAASSCRTLDLLPADYWRYYLLANGAWLTTKDLKGQWEPTQKLPKDMSKLPAKENFEDVKKFVPPPPPRGTVPKVFFRSTPAELITFNGAPAYSKIPGTELLYATNTENDLFVHNAEKQYYVLLPGRWFRAKELSGPWSYAGNNLPAYFSKIPRNSPRARVVASVPGTIEAADAVMLAQIPTTAVINKKEAEAKAKAEHEETLRQAYAHVQAGEAAERTAQIDQAEQRIRGQHIAPATNVNFPVTVGTRVPREVGFHPLPTDIVTIYPEWRGYEFFLVRDEIVVVDPRTLEIVAVLPA